MSNEGLQLLTIPGHKDNHNRNDCLSVTWAGKHCLGIYPVERGARLLPAYEAAVEAVAASGLEAGEPEWLQQVRDRAERALASRQPVAA